MKVQYGEMTQLNVNELKQKCRQCCTMIIIMGDECVAFIFNNNQFLNFMSTIALARTSSIDRTEQRSLLT